ncbi:hypothetical protein [Microbacterium sp. NPDC096154]|uniref:hypothetical protein n=1 Tax=Microbacterium sp. NPDC096154 TaxID=3155549 RepID=UPI00331D1C51
MLHHASARPSAGSAGVVLSEAHAIDELREVSALLESVWGRTPEGAPMHSDTMRSLVHAGGLVSVARDAAGATGAGAMVGAAVLVRDEPGRAYGIIAAAAPGMSDRGIGFALKRHQRDWCLAHGIGEIRWTFDPLMARNARFNLSKLGAVALAYEESFYGEMIDDINRGDDSDRLVASWVLDAEPRPEPADPGLPPASPDAPVVRDERGTWIGIPRDIDDLRVADPASAVRWRHAVRDAMLPLFARGDRAVGFTRSGHYLMEANIEASS